MREGGREGVREGGREGGREGRREGGRERCVSVCTYVCVNYMVVSMTTTGNLPSVGYNLSGISTLTTRLPAPLAPQSYTLHNNGASFYKNVSVNKVFSRNTYV